MIINAQKLEKISLQDSAVVYVNVSDNLIINAINKSKVYIFGNPKIELSVFKDLASLFKK